MGGGDSALEQAPYLARLRPQGRRGAPARGLRGSKITQERAFENPKVTFLWNTVVEDLAGPAAGKVMTVPLRNVTTSALTDGLVTACSWRSGTSRTRPW